jgi:hypothetical protein
MVSHIAVSYPPILHPHYYEEAIGASECARPDLADAVVAPQRTRQTSSRFRGRTVQAEWHRPSLLTTATVCTAVFSTLALML